MPTSDLRQPVCVELACLQRHPAPRALPEATPNSLDSPGTYLQLRLKTNNIVSHLCNENVSINNTIIILGTRSLYYTFT